jgi:chromosome segregation ATPase
MKSNLAVILAILACAGLGVVLWQQNQSHAAQKQELDKTINSYSNTVSGLQETLAEERSVHTALETKLTATQLKDSNDLAAIAANLSATEASLVKSQAAAKAANDAVTAAATAIDEKNKKIAELEAQKTDLDKESNTLHTTLTNLEVQIQDTKRKLDTAEGDKRVLLAQYERLKAEKEELERKLSDLASLQEQVRTLKDNLSIARRLDYLRQGLYSAFSQKAGEYLLNPQPPRPPATNTTPKSLDVELHQRGDIKINSPASTNPPSTNMPSAGARSTNAPPAR